MNAIAHLQSLNNFTMSPLDLSEPSIKKVNSTIRYTMNTNPHQNIEHARLRCVIAQMAEQKTANHMNGDFMDCDVNFDDPFTYAFDVLSGIEYYGTRIEVKTHQSNAKWIAVNIEKKNEWGMINLHHFLSIDVADYIAIYDSKRADSSVNFKTVFMGTREQLKPLIRKSNFKGWYLHIN